ncbi:MAG: KUP/HAK/KT family potassium transporter [Arcanobacterium sp.]|nr:KUP/HAK/KT family potassium transporter [Arcanobacterium sp.]
MSNSYKISAHSRGGILASLTALGVVFGDIGTSPLYVMRAVFATGHIQLDEASLLGLTSCIIWALIVLVTGKYVLLVLRADNRGEGGIIALATLVRSLVKRHHRLWVLAGGMGIFGAALFFGDSVITPAISVLSAVEGLTVDQPGLASLVVPVALVLLTALFAMQHFGTATVGKLFGPIMLLWFVSFVVMGLPQIVINPTVLIALSPLEGAAFMVAHPLTTFIALGAIVLALTGAEALYADIAHFGRPPIQGAWFAVVLPALIIMYLGQAALLLRSPSALENPFFLLAPEWARIPLLIGATAATLIASQAVISGAYSVAMQCSRLRFLPHVRVQYTSESEKGQVYLPGITWLLYAAVAIVVLLFGSSEKLSGAYGLAVSTDFILTTTLLLVVTHFRWKWKWIATVALGLLLAVIELPLWAANVIKISTGGWLPLLIATVLVGLMLIWRNGEEQVTQKRLEMEVPLTVFLSDLSKKMPRRIPGTAIYFHSLQATVPLMLKRNVQMHRSLHDRVLIVSMKTVSIPHTDPATRAEVLQVPGDLPGVYHVIMRYGFKDARNPLADLAASSLAAVRTWDFTHAYVFTGHLVFEADESHHIHPLHSISRAIFIGLSRASASPSWIRRIPADQQAEGTVRIAL